MTLIQLIGELAALHAQHGGEVGVVSNYSCIGDTPEPYFDDKHGVVVL